MDMKTVWYTVVLLLVVGAGNVAGENGGVSYDPFGHYEKAMGVLIGWGGASVAAGIPMALNDDPWIKRIGSQNILWGSINTTIGIAALAMQHRNRGDISRDEKISSFRKAMVINGLLDVVYITSGILMSRFSDKVSLQATGVGFVIQGSFLLAFDWANYGLTFR